MPVAFVPHGGGPWPFVDVGFPAAEVASLKSYLESVSLLPHVTPKALLVVSGHWEERLPTVTTSERPPLVYDYAGFPESAYTLASPARCPASASAPFTSERRTTLDEPNPQPHILIRHQK